MSRPFLLPDQERDAARVKSMRTRLQLLLALRVLVDLVLSRPLLLLALRALMDLALCRSRLLLDLRALLLL